jgi:FkbM family methyltransferase
MSITNPPVVERRSSPARLGAWDHVTSGVGYHLDNLARWLVRHAPRLADAYARLLQPGAPQLSLRPGWRFAEEYYDQRRWFACRRGALWEAVAKQDSVMSLILPWHGDTTVDVTLGNDNSLCLYVCGSFEPNEFVFFDSFMRPGMVFVDVGANDGYYSTFAATRVGKTGRVIAVEPSSRERINLRRNLQRNGLQNVTIVPAALGAAAGEADLRLAEGVHSGHNTLGMFAHDDVAAMRVEQVDVETLDHLVNRLGVTAIDFIKIDVEGAEASVIAGGCATLRAMQPVLLMEINDMALRAQRNSADQLLATLRDDFDYEILIFSADTGRLAPLVEGASLSPNIVAAPKHRAAQLLGRG